MALHTQAALFSGLRILGFALKRVLAVRNSVVCCSHILILYVGKA